jgi:putative GTP pyrophosphokinase
VAHPLHPDGLSGNRIKAAGKLLRNWYRGEPCVQSDVDEAVTVLMTYRKRFSGAGGNQPLASVSMSLRSMVHTSTGQRAAEVTQRLKRVDRIIGKLDRHPHMQLTTMDDIGGCRVVVPGLDELRKVERYLERRWSSHIKTRRDYITCPKDTGYRAVHLVVIRGGMPIEVQLRTTFQQAWASSVEQEEARSGMLLKDGKGDADTQQMYRLIGEALANQDAGLHSPESLIDEIVRLGKIARGGA